MQRTGSGIRPGMRAAARALLTLTLSAVVLLSWAPAGAVCLANGKSCGVNAPANDRLCCPGSVCGWGNVCQAACRINGILYQNGVRNPGNPCQSCQPGVSTTTWSPIPNGSTCTDGNACTLTDRCQAGVCSGTNPVVCTASDQCHLAGTCNPGTGACSNPAKADGVACNDGNLCTQADTCQSGTCSGANPVACPAPDQCHVAGLCNPATGACSNPTKADGAACNDGNACSRTDTCQAGTCSGANPVVCTALDQCHVAGLCNPPTGVCSNPAKANGAPCSDDNACTLGDTCQVGVCSGGSPQVCPVPDQCHTLGTCNPATGSCSNPAKADGSACDDSDPCTVADICFGGVCTAGDPPDCDDRNDCTVDSCNSQGSCAHADRPDGSTCEGTGACGAVFTCSLGECGPCTPPPPTCVVAARYVDNGDGTITDRSTCLVWEKKTGVVGGAVNCDLAPCPDPHGVNNFYQLSTCSTPACPADGSAFVSFLAALNAAAFAGHQDWRLPSNNRGAPPPPAAELQTIHAPCPGGALPCIDPIFGPTLPGNYWSTTSEGDPAFAVVVSFGDNLSGILPKNVQRSVRAVRGGSYCYDLVQDCGETGVDVGGPCSPGLTQP